MSAARRPARSGGGTSRTPRRPRVPRQQRPPTRRPSARPRPTRTRRALTRFYTYATVAFCVAAGIAGYLRAWNALVGIIAAAAFLLVAILGTRQLANGVRRGFRPHRGTSSTRQRRATRSLTAVDAMDGTAFEHHVAALCMRDGCTQIQVNGGAGDLGADVTGRLPNGRSLVIQCKRYAPDRSVGSPDMQRFVGTARPVHNADVALFVASCRFTAPARDLAHSQRIVTIDRELLGLWMTGTALSSIIAMTATGPARR
ncbi:restriction endonuclease [Yinghuangia sp. ASG 101]|uniref:restriction endonuclease n=1 Tax=Yinghuangia sp. ASG 101 TaxID=2896848 RepID=UPI001E536529|nr:restriction endonuclease [Yinghuangia sp. ASG 101]UGQ09318.1 restriction endonuclease [Yinghuangia sp. ASG 101]